ncbi:hypothetical protein K9M59_01835 [Candidatus Gracilibacteria bacterium]|nr:hypothetical protein [Candidatus Gracilibacteria bacterium]MCF7819590.1 hypothetical protein [Candidatus Gracilibacteria bacterium]
MKGFLKFLASATVGLFYGLLFAQKPGKKLRSELQKSDNPAKILFHELKNVDIDARDSFVKWAKNSEELQEVIQSGREQFDSLVKAVKSLGDEAVEAAEKELEKVSENAQKAAKELRQEMQKKGAAFKKKASTKAKKKSEAIKKDVKTIAKKKTSQK